MNFLIAAEKVAAGWRSIRYRRLGIEYLMGQLLIWLRVLEHQFWLAQALTRG